MLQIEKYVILNGDGSFWIRRQQQAAGNLLAQPTQNTPQITVFPSCLNRLIDLLKATEWIHFEAEKAPLVTSTDQWYSLKQLFLSCIKARTSSPN